MIHHYGLKLVQAVWRERVELLVKLFGKYFKSVADLGGGKGGANAPPFGG